MSNTVDDRVVEMRFDNKDFESNANESISTLEKLKKALKLDDAGKGLQTVDDVAKHIDMSGLIGAVDTVRHRFSALEIMGVTALANITNSAVNAGKRIVSALTVEPIKTGLDEYEEKINSVQTILMGARNKDGTAVSLEQVKNKLEELNLYADKTIYSFKDMTSNIGKFTNAGVNLDDSVAAIQGVANVAAVSGANAQQASHAMYNFAQALSSGYVKLIDWKSIENANMATVEFKEQLIQTAVELGTLVEVEGKYQTTTTDAKGKVSDLFDATMGFNDALSNQWMTTEVLTQTLAKYSDETTDIGKKAFAAAQDVKTLSQLFDTLKEAAQSGWSQTWEYIIGDFEEAKKLWTAVSQEIGGILDEQAKARNDMLKQWKELGGRDALLEGLSNVWKSLKTVIEPVKEAFSEIFPPKTGADLLEITKRFAEFTKTLIPTEETIAKIKDTFKGLFSLFDIIGQAIGSIVKAVFPSFGSGLKNVTGGLLDVAAAIGRAITGLDEFIKETGLFDTVLAPLGSIVAAIKSVAEQTIIPKGAGLLSAILGRIKKRADSVADAFGIVRDVIFSFFKKVSEGVSKLKILSALEVLWKAFKTIGGGLITAGSKIIEFLTDKIANADFSKIFDVIASVSFIKLFQNLIGFFNDVKEGISPLSDLKSILENVTGILDGVKDSLSAFQNDLKAGTLRKLAVSIAILAGALFVISLIDSEKLVSSLAAVATLFGELIAGMTAFETFLQGLKMVRGGATTMIAMAVAVLILASAMKKLSELSWEQIGKGLASVGGLMLSLALAVRIIASDSKTALKGALGFIALALAVKILASACKSLSELSWEQIGKGLAGVGVLLAELAAFTRLLGTSKGLLGAGIAFIGIAAALKIMVSVCKSFSELSWEQIGRGLAAMGGALLEVAIAMQMLPKGMVGAGLGLVIVAGALALLFKTFSKMGDLSFDQIANGLATLGGVLLELGVGLNLMKGTLSGSAALLVAALALAIITPILKALSTLTLEDLVTVLASLAIVFGVFGIAGMALGPMIPVLLGLSAAIALFGAGVLLLGAGLMAIGAGFVTLAAGIGSNAIAIASAITTIVGTIAGLIPLVIQKIGEGLVAFANVVRDGSVAFGEAFVALVTSAASAVKEAAPAIGEAIVSVLYDALTIVAEYIEPIGNALFDILIGLMHVLIDRIPELVSVGQELFGTLFQSILGSAGEIDVESITPMAGAIAALAFAIKTLSAIPISGAIQAVANLDILVADLVGVIAALGGLSKIPGFSELIADGGEVFGLIGQAIGNLVGSFAEGVTSALPKIGEDIAAFGASMETAFSSFSKIDPPSIELIGTLATAFLAITGGSFIEQITSFISNKSTIQTFAESLPALGKALTDYANSLGENVSDAKVAASESMIRTLSTLASTKFETTGILSKKSTIDKIKDVLPSLAEAINGFADELSSNGSLKGAIVDKFSELISSIADINVGNISNVSESVKTSLGTLGDALSTYYSKISGIAFDGKMAESLSFIEQLKEKAKGGIDLGDSSALTSSLGGLGDKVKEMMGGAFDGESMDMSSVADKMTGSFSSALSRGFGNISIDVSPIVSSLISSIEGHKGEMQSAGASLGSSLKAGLSNSVKNIPTIFNPAFTSLVLVIKTKSVAISSAGKSLTNNLVKSLKVDAGTVSRNLTSGLSGAVSRIRSYYGSFYSAGAYAAQGYANGIISKINSVVSAASRLAKAGQSGLKKADDTASPSKEYYKLGSFAGQGYTNALIDYSRTAYKAGLTLSTESRKGLQNAVSRISDLIQNGVDGAPTIRPVLDLSNVRSGAGQIGDILAASGYNINTPYHIDAAAAIVSGRNKVTNDDVVEAIKSLNKELSNVQPSNTYNVNGITYDDGTNIAEAIGVLVRAARMERRA